MIIVISRRLKPVSMRVYVVTEVNIWILVLRGYGLLKYIWLNSMHEEITSRKNSGNEFLPLSLESFSNRLMYEHSYLRCMDILSCDV
jgi:hypothetical protein